MRAIVTGQVGVEKKPYLDAVGGLAREEGERLDVFHLGECIDGDFRPYPVGQRVGAVENIGQAIGQVLILQAQEPDRSLESVAGLAVPAQPGFGERLATRSYERANEGTVRMGVAHQARLGAQRDPSRGRRLRRRQDGRSRSANRTKRASRGARRQRLGSRPTRQAQTTMSSTRSWW